MGNCYYTQYDHFDNKYIVITCALGTSGMGAVPSDGNLYVDSTGNAWVNIWYSVFSV